MEFCLATFSNAELTRSLEQHLLFDDQSTYGCYAVAVGTLEMEAEAQVGPDDDGSSVLQDRELAGDLAATGAPPPESPRRPRTAPRSPLQPSQSRHLRRRQPTTPSASTSLVRPATATVASRSLYGSAQVPDIRISRDPVAGYRESLQVSMRAFRKQQWRPLDVETLTQARDPDDIDRRSCSVVSRPVSAAGSSARFPAPRRRPKSVPAEVLNSRAAAAAAAEAAGNGAADDDGQEEGGAEARRDAAVAADGDKDAASPREMRPLELEDCAPAFTPRFFDWQGGAQAEAEAAAGMAEESSDRQQSVDGCSDSDVDVDGECDGETDDSSGSGSGSDSDGDGRGTRSSKATPATTAMAAAAGAEETQRLRRRRIPTLNLRPEREPQFLLASSCLEPDMIDFSARLVKDLPRFEFGPALPEPFAKASFRSLAECDNGWRSVFPEALAPEPSLVGLMDRLIVMERMQLDTVRLEGSRSSLLRRAASSVSVSASEQRPARMVSGGRPRSRNCCRGCLQVACAGDCPLKRAPPRACLHCRQPLCLDRACLRRTYDERARDPDLQPQQPQQKPALLQSKLFKPCGASPSHQRLQQQQQQQPQQQQQQQQQVALLTKPPRSQLPTYSSSVQSRRQLRLSGSADTKLRQLGRLPTSVNFSEQFREATGSTPIDVTREQNCFRPYSNGRNAILPGKSRSSMRRNSLTARRVLSANALA